MAAIKLIFFALLVTVIFAAAVPRHEPFKRAKRSQNAFAAYRYDGNVTYFSANFVIPPAPLRDPEALGGIELQVALESQDLTQSLYLYLLIFVGRDNQTSNTVSLCGWDSCADSEGNFYAPFGATVRAELFWADNTWYMRGYVDGVEETRLQFATYNGIRISVPNAQRPKWPNYQIGTAAETVAQGYVAVKDADWRYTSSRTFVIGNDSYIYLSANPSLVLDVSGGVAKEGARVVLFAKKTPAALNQQWEIINGSIYSKLAAKAFSLGKTADGKVILTKLTRDIWYLDAFYNTYKVNWKGPASARISLNAGGIACNWLSRTNKLDITNIVLRRGTQQVTPTWTGGVVNGDCQFTANSTSNSIKFGWNSAI